MGRGQTKRTVESGNKIYVVYYRYFTENSSGYDEHGQQVQVFTRKEYAKKFLKALGIEPKEKTAIVDGWCPRKYYGYDQHEEIEYTIDELYGDMVAPPQLKDEVIYEAWTEQAAAVIIEAVIDPMYGGWKPFEFDNNAYMIEDLEKIVSWNDDRGNRVCPKCSKLHDHRDNFCPNCGLDYRELIRNNAQNVL